MRVTIAPIGETTKSVEIEKGDTVGSVLAGAGVDAENRTVYLAGKEVDLDKKVKKSDLVITVSGKAKGGR